LQESTPADAAGPDPGVAAVLHAESGDAVIHGETGSDVLLGDGQDDQVLGGAGNDRIYGGAGEDSILGDDGRFILSRNGLTEPLYGFTTPNAQVDITIPGPFTGAWIYITGRLNSTVRLLDPTRGGNDLIYGGLGDDFIHAGAGDDAVSGGEARAAWFNTLPVGAAFYANGGYPVADPTSPLGYNATTRKLAAYDANNPLTKIANFFLNFDAADGSAKIDDGKDRVFGDTGNDWLVGGTDNDRLFGGQGDDQINADDNLDTAGGLNNQPDTVTFADRDFVYGGDGLDVMIANTGGDRLFDWGGEFNSYVVPFSPFGEPTVTRRPSPAVQQFLLDLGRESGADQGLAEPTGELGLFTQGDPQWQANHGGPRDPQPGNTHARRDTQGGPEDDRGTALPLAATAAVAPAAVSPAAANTIDLTVNNVGVYADPSDPTHNALFIGGTSGADTILVKQGTTAAFIDVVVNGVDKGQFALTSGGVSIGRILIYGNDGNDTITIGATAPALDAYIYGGAGDDTIVGGAGSAFIDGGDGNDTLTSISDRNVLIGGDGLDVLTSGKGDDVLIGATYAHSDDLDLALAVLAVWKSSASYDDRVSSLRTGGVDALFALNSTTILDDSAADKLSGNQGVDWFWAAYLDITDKKGNETLN
jgi:Ca2+-binding RTX toxin-like protein